MTTLDRYLLREILTPLFVGLSLFVVVLVFVQLIEISDALTGLGVSGGDVAQALMFSFPPLMGLLLPVSLLFAILLGVGRVASDREVRGLCAAGISPYRLLRVPVALGVILGACSGFAMLVGESWGVKGLRDLMSRSAQRSLAGGVRAGHFHAWLDGITFYAGEREGDELTDVFFADLRDPSQPIVVSASAGAVRAGSRAKDIVLEMTDGNIVVRGAEDRSRVIRFDQSRYRLDVHRLVGNKGRTLMPAQERSNAQLWAETKDMSLTHKHRATSAVTLYRRFTLPLATIIFSFLAVPLACKSTGNARARGFIFSAIIVGGYYYVGRTAEVSARYGDFPVLLASLLPILIGSVFTLFFVWRFGRTAA